MQGSRTPGSPQTSQEEGTTGEAQSKGESLGKCQPDWSPHECLSGKAMQTQMYFTGANTKCSVFPQHRHSDKRREYQHSFCSGSSAMLTAWAICHGRVCAPPDSTDNAPAPSPSLGSSTTPAAFNASVSSWPSCIKSDTTGGSIQPGPSPRWYVPATQMAQTQMSIRPPSSRRTPLSIPSPRATPVVRQQATVGRCDATRGCGVSNADC
eukprot:GGOE01022152.1.p1 GENE.GGOE01022152.1~~GGOE01022152.1.p1  ORF type:complete len:209 (-),score=18.87 GGOE01022152.1:106-732(-)